MFSAYIMNTFYEIDQSKAWQEKMDSEAAPPLSNAFRYIKSRAHATY